MEADGGVTAEVIGRDQELAELRAFIDAADGLPAALVVEGEPGIGKTVLWRATLELARDRGWIVLTALASEAEATLSFAGLGDLLEPVLGDVSAALTAPQRRALEVALLLAEPEGPPPDTRAVGAGVLAALRTLATRPLLVAIDDVQWLDEASLAVLRFAARRLSEEPIAILATRRNEAKGGIVPPPLDSGRWLQETRFLHIGSLPLGALHGVLQVVLGTIFTRPTLRRLHETTDGNPLYALEIARVLVARDLVPASDEPLPVPDSLDQILVERVAALSRPARTVTLLVATASQVTLPLLKAALSRRAGDAGISGAIKAGILQVEGERIRFTHPLLRSVVFAAATAEQRRAAHRSLARILRDPEERAMHLAQAAVRPDEAVADSLERAAARAVKRGAPDAGTRLAEHAARLTPLRGVAERARRLLAAADAMYASGEGDRARALLRDLIQEAPPGSTRARALLHLADYTDGYAAAVELCQRALAEAAGEPALQAWTHRSLALWLSLTDLSAAGGHAEQAVALAKEIGDSALLAHALTTLGLVKGLLTEPDALETLERAVALKPERAGGLSITYGPSVWLGVNLVYRDSLDAARDILETEHRRAVERGDEGEQIGVLLFLSELECRAGNWGLAARHAREGWERARQLGSLQEQAALAYAVARVAAHRGDTAEARRAAEGGAQIAMRLGDLVFEAHNRTVLGFLELSLGEPGRANKQLAKAVALIDAVGIKEPSVIPAWPLAIEALASVGELTRARELSLRLEEPGRELEHRWALATSQRCRGLIAAAEGDLTSALKALDGALKAHDRLPEPFERARTLLVLGAVRRREKQRRSAREALGEALGVFEQLGAPLWADKARAELARIGGRTASGRELTATEERVAELVAQGLTNKAVASELFVTDRTVEGHLSRIYAKLGVRSRAELASRFARRG